MRGLIKLPTAKDDEEGVGTGKADFAVDAIVSKEINERVELSGFGGFIFRGDPDDVDLANGFRWGFGAGFPTRKNLRLTAELHGEQYFGRHADVDTRRSSAPTDRSRRWPDSTRTRPSNASLGLTWLGKQRLFAGAGINWHLSMDGRSDFGQLRGRDRRRRSASSSGSAITPACASTCRRRRRRRRRAAAAAGRTARRP